MTARSVRKARAKRKAVETLDPLTGDRVRRVREAYGLTMPQFARLLGVAVSSAYRWEAGDASRAGDRRRGGVAPLQRTLIRLMERFADEAKEAPRTRRGSTCEVGTVLSARFVALAVEPANLHTALALGERGELRGLYAFLHAVYGGEVA